MPEASGRREELAPQLLLSEPLDLAVAARRRPQRVTQSCPLRTTQFREEGGIRQGVRNVWGRARGGFLPLALKALVQDEARPLSENILPLLQ